MIGRQVGSASDGIEHRGERGSPQRFEVTSEVVVVGEQYGEVVEQVVQRAPGEVRGSVNGKVGEHPDGRLTSLNLEPAVATVAFAGPVVGGSPVCVEQRRQ
jgi:hypothetical protein